MKDFRDSERVPPTPSAKPLPAARAPEAVIQIQLPPPLVNLVPQFNGTGCADDAAVEEIRAALEAAIDDMSSELRPSFDIACVTVAPQPSQAGEVQRRATTLGLWFPPLGDDVDTQAALNTVDLIDGAPAELTQALLRSRANKTLFENVIDALIGEVDRKRVVITTDVSHQTAQNTVTTTATVFRKKKNGSAGMKYIELRWVETPKRDTAAEVCPPRQPIFVSTDRRFNRFLERDHLLNFLDRWTNDLGKRGVLGEFFGLLPLPRRIAAPSFEQILTGTRVFPSFVVHYDNPRVAADHVAIDGSITQQSPRMPCVSIRRANASGPASLESTLPIEVEVASDETDTEVRLRLRADVFDVRRPSIAWQIEGATPANASGPTVIVRVPTAALRPFGRIVVDVTATARDVEFSAETNQPPLVVGRRQVVFKMLPVVATATG